MTQTLSLLGRTRIVGLRNPVIGSRGARVTGIALQADSHGDGFHLVLMSRTRALLSLGPYADEEVIAEWRGLAARTGLPQMIRLTNGATLAVMGQLGSVRLGEIGGRKVPLGERRPRFLAGRKRSRMAAIAVSDFAGDPLEEQGRQSW